MNARTVLFGLASAVTTFLVVGAVGIELLSGLYGESPGVGILGVALGVAVGLPAGVVVAYAFSGDRLSGVLAVALVAYGAFGVAFLTIAGLQYVNAPGADEVFTFPVHLGASVLLAVVAAVIARGRRRGVGATV